jgi:zinc-binding in reverse transcriptase
LESKGTHTVKIFFYLLLHDKLLMHQLMVRRKMLQTQPGCLMCRNCLTESALHLFFLCPTVVSVWSIVQQAYNIQLWQLDIFIVQILQKAYNTIKRRERAKRQLWIMVILASCWHLWKQRNDYVFGEASLNSPVPHWIIVNIIVTDVHLWRKYC